MWQDALIGVALSVVPTVVASVLIQRYSMYLAKIGRGRVGVVFLSLLLLALLSFSLTFATNLVLTLILKADYKPWLYKGGILGILACVGVAWLRLCVKIVSYEASYFIEYVYPRQIIIRGVPILIALIFAFAVWRSGLVELAGVLASRTHNPAFCKLVHDKDRCQEQFYDPELLAGRQVDPSICRALSGVHVVNCLIKHHPAQPDIANCKALKDREGEDSVVYYWCLSFLPRSRDAQDACRRAESSSHWVNAYYGNCLKETNVNDKIESGKTVLMQFLDIKQLSERPEGRRKLGVKYPLEIRTQLVSLLGDKPELEKADREGRTLIFYVRTEDDLKALLDKGAKVNHQDQNGLTAPMYWVMNHPGDGFARQLSMLAKHGHDVNIADKKNRTLLSHFLLTLKDEPDDVKNSPDNVAFVEAALRLGANPYLRDKNKKRPVDYAKDQGLTQILATLHNYRDYQPGAN